MTNHDANPSDPEDLKHRLNRETGKIRWSALVQHQREAAVIQVEDSLDLIAVAREFALDNHEQVKIWLENARIAKVDDLQAQTWQAEDPEMWAVVVAPWVLVQAIKAKSGTDLFSEPG